MHYYQFKGEKRYGSRGFAVDENDPAIFEISEAEYIAGLTELQQAERLQNAELAEADKDARIAELEAENAALLFQLLTGEAYADV